MNPLFFGASARQLFGVYESSRNATRGGVVLCPPLGNEYLFSHPTYKLLARLLAEAGYHVLRFDYYGSGDSAGEFEQTDQAQWVADVSVAVDELKDLGNLQRVSLIGLRYGATIAAQAAMNRPDIERLVLWNPVVDGTDYLAEVAKARTNGNAEFDADGVVITPRIREDIERTTIDSFGPDLPPTLILATTTPADQYEILLARLKTSKSDATLQHVSDVPAWRNSHLSASAMPVSTLQVIVRWMP